jgi:hypothetical protein
MEEWLKWNLHLRARELRKIAAEHIAHPDARHTLETVADELEQFDAATARLFFRVDILRQFERGAPLTLN